MLLSMGPQHPSTHGVLRLLVELDGENVVNLAPDIGFLHTGIEKTMESKTYTKALVMTDRMDYLAPLSNNLGYMMAVEKLLDVEVPPRAQVIRVILTELTRIASHLVWLQTTTSPCSSGTRAGGDLRFSPPNKNTAGAPSDTDTIGASKSLSSLSWCSESRAPGSYRLMRQASGSKPGNPARSAAQRASSKKEAGMLGHGRPLTGSTGA